MNQPVYARLTRIVPALRLLPALLLALGLGAAPAQEAPPVVTVGTLFPYTGGGSEWGPVLRNTAQLAADQINAAATEVFGGPIMELVFEDSATNPTVGVDRARKLVDVDRVPVLIGTWSSGVAIAIADSVTMPLEVLHVVPIATSPLITVLPSDTNDLLFRTIGSDAQQAVVAAQLARGELVDGYSHDTASIIFVNNPYGQALADAFTTSFEARGGQVLASVAIPEEAQPTYAAQIEEALRGGPSVVLPIIYPSQGSVLLAEMRDTYDYTSWQFMDAMRATDVLEAVGAEAIAGALGTTPAADEESAGYRRFAEAYAAAYGEEPPLSFMDTTYDAVAITGLAIASAVAQGVEIDSYNLRDQLRPVGNAPGERVLVGDFERALTLLAEGAEIDYSGAASEVEFDDAGQVITPVEVWRFTDTGIDTVSVLGSDEIPQE